jgi:rsbT co-antagonist protein RsbR
MKIEGVVNMKSVLTELANHLEQNQTQLACRIVDSVLERMDLVIPNAEKERAFIMYNSLLKFLSDSLKYEGRDLPLELIEWSKRNAFEQVTTGGEISDIIVRYAPTREVFTNLISEWDSQFYLSTEAITLVINKINSILDISLEETVIAFEELNRKMKKDFRAELEILSFPVVLLKEDVAVIPLMGTINEHRINYLLEQVLPKVNELKIDHLIVDYSGVCTFNEFSAPALHQMSSMLGLLGIKVIITGISPQLAQTAMKSGIDTVCVTSYQSVKQALESFN